MGIWNRDWNRNNQGNQGSGGSYDDRWREWEEAFMRQPPTPPTRPTIWEWRRLSEPQRMRYDEAVAGYLMALDNPRWWELLDRMRWFYLHHPEGDPHWEGI